MALVKFIGPLYPPNKSYFTSASETGGWTGTHIKSGHVSMQGNYFNLFPLSHAGGLGVEFKEKHYQPNKQELKKIKIKLFWVFVRENYNRNTSH